MKDIIKINEIVIPPFNNKFNYFKEIKLLFDKGFHLNNQEVTSSLFYRDIHVAEKLVFNKIKVNFGEVFLFLLEIASTSSSLREIEFIDVNFDRVDAQAFDAFYSSFSLSAITFKNVCMKPEVKNQIIVCFEEYNHKPLTNKLGNVKFYDQMFMFFKIKYNNVDEDTYQLSVPIEVFSEVAGALYQITDHVIEYSGL